MILLQITDHKKCEIALFGDYVDHLKHLIMAKADEGLPVLVMQFAKVKIFRECDEYYSDFVKSRNSRSC